MRVVLDGGAFPPIRAHETDAGLDLRAMHGATVPAMGSAIFDTGVHIELPSGCCGLVVSRSGLYMHHGITSTGLVDEAYQGSIFVKLCNHSREDYFVFAGDKISQLVIIPCRYESVEIVEEFGAETDRGSAGFGSTGR